MYETRVKGEPAFDKLLAQAASLTHTHMLIAHEIVLANSDKLGGPADPKVVCELAHVVAANFATLMGKKP